VLIDALFDKPNPEYRAPAPEVLDKIMKGAAPYNGMPSQQQAMIKSTHSTPRAEARGIFRVNTERRFLPRFKNRGFAPRTYKS
jgi:hypothetical protein